MTRSSDSLKFNETEIKILKAAEKEFMAKGFAGARTTTIAETAGVTHAMFHYYFRTKEKLFDRIISEKLEMLREVILQSLKNVTKPLEEIIRDFINNYLDFIAANPELPRFLICEVLNSPERLNVFTDKILTVAPEMLSRLQQKIDAAAAEGECRKIDARMLMLDIVSLNVFPYIASPIVNCVLDGLMSYKTQFLELRKKENFDTIMCKLKP